jgi:hypothetical protein
MPQWIHNRAEHIQDKNPGMPESESWAIATNQYKKSSGKDKSAQLLLPFLESFSDELSKIANAMMGSPSTVGEITSTVPKNTMKMTTPKYTKVNPDGPASPAQSYQPVLSPPPVRG